MKEKNNYEIKHENNKVTGLIVSDSNTGELETIEAKGIFPFVGMDPVTDFAKGLNITDAQGYILTDENMETELPKMLEELSAMANS